MSQVKIKEEVAVVLNAAKWHDDIAAVQLQTQLSPKEYKEVNKVIELAGGRWTRNKGMHMFKSDDYQKLRDALAAGSIRDDKKHFQEYFTPPALAARVVELAQVGGFDVLEPSAGRGALAKECLAQGATSVFCYEIQPQHAEALKLDGRYKGVVCGDFLKNARLPADRFPRIVMNPPFTKGAALKHVAHALEHCLAPGGRLVAVLPDIRDTRPFLKFICPGTHSMQDFTLEKVPDGTFQEAGTGVRTMVMVINKKP